MELDNKQVYIGIFAIALVICLLSPFLASGDPDGLEASAEHINPDALEAEQVISPIMPDYTLEGLEENPLVGVACLIIGALMTVALAYGVFYIIKK
ncbi:MAG: PDGLE domain-containing protein [Methanosphaera sp.]|uniref:PDGLE domain-containing protein n=1 Tax=Methanosphaera sp. TaxID=2666342 RepID=UPI002E7825CB|nr:PDGLE domain-containing protein [Methanosphaera sp.]MEE1117431.1 PDGLE domain-containing protein [Methanosphaera sp.]MEE3419464.1 PDGLE domain-containing protein [Methanosphaera sp.]